MQQAQRRDMPEQISWARAMIFAVGFFFIAALLIGQVPGYIFLQLTAATLQGAEEGLLALGLTCLAAFVVIQVIVMLFDPKPVVPPVIFTVLGIPLAVGGIAVMIAATATGCNVAQAATSVVTCNQYFPYANTSWLPVLGGNVLWFEVGAVDFVMVGAVLLGVGVAMIFYSQLAIREQSNPDRRDLGTTPAIRFMIIAACVLLVIFMLFFTAVSDQGLANQIAPHNAFWAQKIIDYIESTILGVAIFLTLGAFALRLHYLMRPVRKRTMSVLYAVGALGFAQLGAILVLLWIVLYPLIAWMHTWSFIGLDTYLTICSNKLAIPSSCFFTPEAGYIVDAIVTTNSFILLMAAIWAWKSHRNVVIIGGVVTAAVLGIATLLVHMYPTELLIALLLCGGALVMATIWTASARHEFAIVGENRLGCLGMWLVMGTCLFIYLGAFAFFSIPGFRETEPNVPFVSGSIIAPVAPPGQPPILTASDAVVMLVLFAILSAIQFYFLTRNRYRV
jgi:hypothetical protein